MLGTVHNPTPDLPSRKTTLESPIKAIPTLNLRFIPPDRFLLATYEREINYNANKTEDGLDESGSVPSGSVGWNGTTHLTLFSKSNLCDHFINCMWNLITGHSFETCKKDQMLLYSKIGKKDIVL